MSRNGMRLAAWLGIAAVMVLGLLPATGQAKTTKPPAKSTKTKSTKTKTTKATASVREIPVTFSVVNSNATSISCHTDGKTYTIVGTLFLPKGATPSGVTLYAHGLGYAGYFWDFSAVPGYNYAGYEADQGHASLVIDRLGYGKSGKPAGADSCIGGQATVLHEIIQDLRTGGYAATGANAAHPSFSRIGLVGHSVGGQIVEVEAYTFGDIQALGVMDWDDADYSAQAYGTFTADAANCGLGGTSQVGGGPSGYSPFGGSTAAYDAIMFAGVDPAVESAANGMRELDPCGDVASVLSAAAIDLTKVGAINVPIAFVWGSDDAIFPGPLAPWAQTQEALYRDSPKVTNIELPGSGHAVTLERNAPLLQREMSTWLTANHL